MPTPGPTPDDQKQSTSRKVTDPGLTDAERKAIVQACQAAGGHFVSRDPAFPRQYGRCTRCDKYVGG